MARSVRLFSILLLVSLVLSGCMGAGPEWIDAGATYSPADVRGVFARVQRAPGEGQPVSDAADLRHTALVGLRRRGGAAAQATDLITKTFPATAGVPVYVERVTFEDDANALVVVELIGPDGGVLSDMRLWVVSSSGDILFSAVR